MEVRWDDLIRTVFVSKELHEGGVDEAGVFPLGKMPGIRRDEERTAGNGHLQGLSYRKGKDLIVCAPKNERGVRNVRYSRGKSRFPFRDLIQL